jgi:membrane dipeptidase
LIGADHVGIGGDYNGIDETPEGLEDTSKYPHLFDKLAEDGWSREDLKKLAGLNLIRVFKDVEKIRDSLKREKTFEDNIEYESINTEQIRKCRKDVDLYNPEKTVKFEQVVEEL